MKATYEGPTSNKKDMYRFLLNDTDTEHPILYDEEIQFVIDSNHDHNKIMCTLLEVILNCFAKKPRRSLGPQSEDYTETIKTYRAMYDKYTKLNASTAVPVSMCKSKAIFYKGMHDNV